MAVITELAPVDSNRNQVARKRFVECTACEDVHSPPLKLSLECPLDERVEHVVSVIGRVGEAFMDFKRLAVEFHEFVLKLNGRNWQGQRSDGGTIKVLLR
jgi:hypothetical protein